MSVMERRLQLLLDAERYALVAGEAARSGRSVASVIREAIDVRFEQESEQARRSEAMRAFLAMGSDEGVDDGDVVAELNQEFEDYVNRKAGL